MNEKDRKKKSLRNWDSEGNKGSKEEVELNLRVYLVIQEGKQSKREKKKVREWGAGSENRNGKRKRNY